MSPKEWKEQALRVVRDKRKTRTIQPFSVRPSSAGRQAALDAIHFSRSIGDIVEFALVRKGYCNCDCFAGVDYQIHTDNKTLVTQSYIAVYSGNGEIDGPSHEIPELEYLQILKQYLELNQEHSLAGVLSDHIQEYAGFRS